MKSRYLLSCAIGALLSGGTSMAFAADADAPGSVATAAESGTSATVEELVVTAQRRNESLQKVPLTVQAFSGDTISKLNITSLDGLLKFTPNVSYGNNGPGQGNIFIRGLSAGFAGNQSSATAGNFPNVAVYLDDQSFQFPARNADIYLADMERVEVLEGPQGTLFGGGAEAGAVRYITNKPKLDRFEGSAEASYGFTTHGDPNDRVTATLNVPIVTDKLAIRAVIYNERQGGYIDNVPSTFTRANSDLGNYYFNITLGTNGLCPNGLAPGSAGLCAVPNAPQANNFAIARKAQNPTTYTGARISLAYKINDDWDILIAQSLQNLDADGISAQYDIGSDFQTLQPRQITAFTPSYDKDKFENTSWTVNGKLGPLRAIYTGGYLERNISQQQEYSNYSRTGGGIYYQCTGGSTGFGTGAPICYSPVGYWQDTVRNTHLTQEIRLSTPDDWRIRAIGGFFYEDFKIYDNQNFNYKTDPSCNAQNLATALAGGPPCVANVTTAPGSTANFPGQRSDSTAFGEDTQRGYSQYAFFGSVDFDVIPSVLTVTGGTRYYHYSEFEVGSQYATTTGCLNVPNGQCVGGLVNIDAANDHVTYTGFKSRASVNWKVTPTTNAYFTFSQGFRPGGFNRSVSNVAPLTTAKSTAQFRKPNGYSPDSLDNYEIGLKTQLFDRRLQLNLSAYMMDWKNVQFLFFNPTQLGNTTFGVNGPDYNIKGVEAQFIAKPTEGLTLTGSASYNDNRQSNSPCLKDNIPGTPAFGQCITTVKNQPFQNPFGAAGTVAAFSPKFQGNIRARYEWSVGDYRPYVIAGANYTDSSYNQPATYLSGDNVLIPTTTYLRYLQPSYYTVDAAVGVSFKTYSAELFVNNLNDSNASTFTSSAQFIKSEVPIRPRTYGMKIAASF